MKFNHPKLKGYKYLETLGEGGQGMVVKVKDPSERRIYALKLLKPSENVHAEREIKALQQLNHSNIVQIYDADFGTEGAYILMQYMKHGNIQEYIQKNALGIEERLRLIQDVTAALGYVHQEGMIHRDIKPQNIFVTDEGEGAYACLGDFGIVKEFGATTLTKTGGGVGTMLYLSPEVLNNTEKASYKSDMYALGMSLYEVITGKHAYDTSSPMIFFQEMMQKEIVRPSSYDNLISEVLDELCIKSIAKNKEERFENVEEFVRDLEKCINVYSIQRNEKEKEKKESADSLYYQGYMCFLKKDYKKAKNYYEQAVEKGNDDALCALGSLYDNGYGVDQDHGKARECYEKAAAKGNTSALYYLGFLYGSGSGVEESSVKAYRYYKQLGVKGDSNALYSLGFLYENGYGIAQDYVKAREYYERAAEKGDSNALYSLGNIYIEGNGVERNHIKAREYYEKAVEKGDSNALYSLGNIYMYGKGVERNHIKAREYYEKAAEKGDSNALYSLGGIYMYGKGVKWNSVKAREYYEQAADKGCSDALRRLGNIYMEGQGVERNYIKAREYYERHERATGVISMWHDNLYFLYATGLGGKKDFEKARKYYKKVGIVGDSGIFFRLGREYFLGIIVEKDYVRAREYYEKAVEKGDSNALYYLGNIYMSGGQGVEQNHVKAREYYEKAAEKGDSNALHSLGDIYMEGGQGVERNYIRAREYYERHERATWVISLINYNLPFLYATGLGGKKDFEKARKYYKKAGIVRDSEIFFELGKIYMRGGQGVEKDYVRAREYFEKAAEEGHSNALSGLVFLYKEGLGVEKDDDKAREYYKQAENIKKLKKNT